MRRSEKNINQYQFLEAMDNPPKKYDMSNKAMCFSSKNFKKLCKKLGIKGLEL